MSANDRTAEAESADRAENFLIIVAVLALLFAAWWFLSWGGVAAVIARIAFVGAVAFNQIKRRDGEG